MSFKVPHDSFGSHNPLGGEKAAFTDPYALKGATLKYVAIEVNRASTHICWEDIFTGKQYRSNTYLLSDALTSQLPEGKVLFQDGHLFITGTFGFHQYGNHVLLTILEPPMEPGVLLEHAESIFEGFLSGKLKGAIFKREVKLFMKALNTGKEAENNG